MTIQIFTNNAKSTLAVGINSSITTITVAAGTGSEFPNPSAGQEFKVTLNSATSTTVYEICNCTSRTGDVLTVVRGQEGTAQTAFNAGDFVGHFNTAGVATNWIQSEQSQAGTYSFAVAGGSANALTATVSSYLTTAPNGISLVIQSSNANTGPATLNLTLGSTVTGVYPIVKGNNSPLTAGDIPGNGYPMQLNWSNVFNSYVLQNPATGIFVSSVPTGAVVQFPCTTAPTGYLICSGGLISRSTYSALWTFAQSSGNLVSDATWLAGQYGSFSQGDGTTNFRLPQYGGYFLRCQDTGNGIDPARTLGTVQANQNLSHTHSASVTDPGHIHQVNAYVGVLANEPAGTVYFGDSNGTGLVDRNTFGAQTGVGVTNSSSGGSEARPINISILACIKY